MSLEKISMENSHETVT